MKLMDWKHFFRGFASVFNIWGSPPPCEPKIKLGTIADDFTKVGADFEKVMRKQKKVEDDIARIRAAVAEDERIWNEYAIRKALRQK